MKRRAEIRRKTSETDIRVRLNLDGSGRVRAKTGIGFMDHMLELLGRHALWDLEVRGRGDRHVDDHHLVEDLGICLGQALSRALGDRKGLERYGHYLVPMDEALSHVAADVSGRPYLSWKVRFQPGRAGFDFDLLEDFFRALVNESRVTLHVRLREGRSNHHIAESVFKGAGRSLGAACSLRAREKGVPSTKGRLR